MTTRLPQVCLVFLVVSAVFATWSWSGWRTARAGLASEQSRTLQTAEMVREISILETKQQTVALSEAPQQDLFRIANETLREIGLDQRVLTNLRVQSVPARPGTESENLRRQTLRIELRGLRPASLGAFLWRWERSQPLWTPVTIEMTAAPAPRGAPNPGLFNSTLVLEAEYLDTASAATQTARGDDQ
ncbi:MAG: hypothetical protein AAGJ54_06890 [Planctomycetota bacterium]